MRHGSRPGIGTLALGLLLVASIEQRVPDPVGDQQFGGGAFISISATIRDSRVSAIDSGDPAGCVDFAGAILAFDQRGAGFPRVVGPACDKGAFESPVFVDLILLDGFESP